MVSSAKFDQANIHITELILFLNKLEIDHQLKRFAKKEELEQFGKEMDTGLLVERELACHPLIQCVLKPELTEANEDKFWRLVTDIYKNSVSNKLVQKLKTEEMLIKEDQRASQKKKVGRAAKKLVPLVAKLYKNNKDTFQEMAGLMQTPGIMQFGMDLGKDLMKCQFNIEALMHRYKLEDFDLGPEDLAELKDVFQA